jgi:hypothetical protein
MLGTEMWPFTKSAAVEVEPVVHATELRLLEVEKEREQIEEAFDATFRAIGDHDEFRKKLVSEQARVTARRAALFEERASLLKVLGRIK